MAPRDSHYRGDYDRRRATLVEAAYANPATRCGMLPGDRVPLGAGCGLTLAEHSLTKTGRRQRWTADHVRPGDRFSPLRPVATSCNCAAGTRLANARRRRLRTTIQW
jgi:hypothetical protein